MARLFSDADVCSVGSTIVTRDRITVPPLYIGRPELLITDGQFLLSQDGDMGTGTRKRLGDAQIDAAAAAGNEDMAARKGGNIRHG